MRAIALGYLFKKVKNSRDVGDTPKAWYPIEVITHPWLLVGRSWDTMRAQSVVTCSTQWWYRATTGGHRGDLKQMERTDYLRWSSTSANEKQNDISWLLQDNFHLQRRLFRDNKSHHQRPLLVSEGNGWCWWSVKHSVTNFYLASRARYWLHTIRLFQSNLIPFVFSNGFGLPRIISYRIDHITLISRFCPQPPPPMSTAWHCCFSDPLPNLLRRLMVILFMALLWPAR